MIFFIECRLLAYRVCATEVIDDEVTILDSLKYDEGKCRPHISMFPFLYLICFFLIDLLDDSFEFVEVTLVIAEHGFFLERIGEKGCALYQILDQLHVVVAKADAVDVDHFVRLLAKQLLLFLFNLLDQLELDVLAEGHFASAKLFLGLTLEVLKFDFEFFIFLT